MRLVLAVLLLAACSGKPAAAPAWPKMAEREADGGESLAPRAKASAVAAVAEADDDEPVAKPEAKPETKPEAKPDAETPKPASTTQAPEEIIITTEEIVIEIDD